VTRLSSSRHQDFYLQQLALLAETIKLRIGPFVKDVLDLSRDLWANPVLHPPIVSLIETLSRVLDAGFKPHLPAVLPVMLSVSDEPPSEHRQAAEIKMFHALLTFGSNVEEYMHLLLPVLLSAVERPDASSALKKMALNTIGGLAQHVNLSDYASRIIHPLIRILPGATIDVREAIRDTMCSLVFQLGADFAVFIPMVKKVRIHGNALRSWCLGLLQCLLANRIHWLKYEQLISKLLNRERLPIEQGHIPMSVCCFCRTVQLLSTYSSWSHSNPAEPAAPTDSSKLAVNQQHLKQAWDVSRVESKEDWEDWFKKLSTELLRESTSPALRACVSLVDTHPPLGSKLFNAAFISCWMELYDQYQVS